MNSKTIFELAWGGSGTSQRFYGGQRFFPPHKYNDAVVMAAHWIKALDGDPEIWAGWVHLKRLPAGVDGAVIVDGCGVIGWTKTSNETPTTAGFATEAEALR